MYIVIFLKIQRFLLWLKTVFSRCFHLIIMKYHYNYRTEYMLLCETANGNPASHVSIWRH